MATSKISIIIPVYNTAQTLTRCIEAIKKCHGINNCEILVIDDASTNKEVQKIKNQVDKFAINNRNRGPSYSRNRGVEMATGDIFLFIDADTVFTSSHPLKLIASYFSKHPEVDALTGKYSKQTDTDSFFSRYKNYYMNYHFSLLDREVNFLLGAICAIRRQAFTPWDESIRLGEDTALGQTLVSQRKKIHLLKELEVSHLKKYNFLSFFKNNFVIPFHFGKTFLTHRGWKQYRSGCFSHVSRRQLFSLLSVALLLASSFYSWKGVLILATVFLLLNAHYALYLYHQTKSPLFLGKSLVAHFADNIVMGIGSVLGLLRFSLMRKHS